MDIGALKTDIEALYEDAKALLVAAKAGEWSTVLTDAGTLVDGFEKVLADLA